MADIRLAKPAAGASQSITCEPEARFVFDFPTSDATLAREGDNLNIRFEDGSQLQLQGFYQEYNGDNLPSFNIDGTEVAAADFFEAMNEPDLMPAAGPGTGTVANGARFHEWGDSSLAAGITHLNGLDWGFSRSFEWDDVPNAVGRNGDDWGLLYSRGEGGSVPGEPGSPVPGNTVPELTTPPAPEPPVDPDNPGDDPGKPVGPGNPGGYVPSANGASIVVDEGALAGGSGQHVLHGASGKGAFLADVHAERGGSIVLAHGGQSLTLPIPENDATVIGVPQGAAATFVNVNGVDITILGATSNGDGKWTVSYEYTLAGRVEHDKAAHDTVLFDDRGIAITVTDGTGDVTSGRLTVEVHDDVPQFSVESTGAATSLAGSFGLNFGADAAAATGALTAAGATSTTVEGATTHLTFAEGTLSVTNEGGNEFSYTFTPSAAYDNLEFSKDITLTATDGDQDTDTLVITVGQPKRPTLKDPDPDPDPKPTPDPNPDPDPEHPYENLLSVGKIIADEGAMPDGTGAHAEHPVSGKGSFTVDMHGENGTITVSDGLADGAHTATITLDGDHAFVTGDKLHVNGVDVELTGARLEGSEWTVTYRYTLTEKVGHAEGAGKSGEDDTAYGKLMVTATDDDGKEANAVLNVLVHDDAPQFVGEATGGVTSREGSFELSFGADKAAEVDSLTAAGAEKTTVDGNTTTMEFTDGTLTITENDDKTYSYTFTPKDADKDFTKTIELTATDADGDTDTFTIVVGNAHQPSFPGTNPLNVQVGEITTDEGALNVTDEDGNVLIQGTGEHAGHGVKGNQSFRVDMDGEDGTITVSDGDRTTTITIVGNRAEVGGDRLLHINGVDVEVTDAVRLSGSEWTVNYKYALTERVEHELAGKSGEDDRASETLTVTAAYAGEGATPVSAELTVNVHDDAPQFTGEATGDAASLTGRFGLSFGADKAAELDSLTATGATVTVDGTTTVMAFEDGTLTITENADKSYSYTFAPNDTAGDTFEKHIELIAKDSDGDTDTFTIVVGNAHQPSFPGTNPLDIKVGAITADEGALPDGTGVHKQHGITGEQSFTVDMHGEDGSITVSDHEGHTVTITLNGETAAVSGPTLHVNGVDMVVTGAELVDGQWQVNYTYTLTERVEHELAGKSGEDDPASATLTVTAAYAGEDATPVSATLKIEVHDDAPQFTGEATGDAASLAGKFGLSFGADKAAVADSLTATGATVTVDGTTTVMAFEDGTLTITENADKSYSYSFEPNDTAGDTFEKHIELTATDSDGDTDTFTIVVGNAHQPSFPGTNPLDIKVGEITVDEGALPDGTGVHKEHGITGERFFTVDMHGEDGSITVSDHEGHTVTITLNGETATVSGPTLHVNGVDMVVTGAQLVDSQWQVNYTYTLTERVEHELAGKSGEDDTAPGKLDVTATYAGENATPATAVINVLVHDDAPQFDVVTPDSENSLKGGFGLNFGADGMAESYPLRAEGAFSTKAEGDTTTMEFAQGTLTITRGENNEYSYTFTPNATYKDLEFSRDIKLTATDKDGDTDVITITVGQEFPPVITTVIPGTDPNEPEVKGVKVIVDEALLDDGTGTNEAGGLGDGHAVTGSYAFSVNLHGEEGTIVIEAGSKKVTFNIDATTAADGVPDAKPADNAELEVNGVTITFTNAELVDGQWQVHYDYKLGGRVEHDEHYEENLTGAADPKVDSSITITVTDSDGLTDSGKMIVEVHDDGPQFSVEATGDKASVAGVFELNFGADGMAETGALTAADMKEGTTPTVSGNTTSMEFTEGTLTVTRGEGNAWSYEFTPNEAYQNLEFSKQITLTAKDGDRDTASITITVGQEKAPTITTLTGVDVTDGTIIVDEGAMAGTVEQAHKEHGITGKGSFTVDMHGENGSITISDGTDEGKITITITDGGVSVSGAKLHVKGVDVEFTGAKRSGSEWTVSYKYTLTEPVDHEDGAGKSGADDPAYGQLTVVASDDDGKEASATLNVEVHDDAPVFTLEPTSHAKTFEGEFGLNFGADKAAANNSLTAAGEDASKHVESGNTTTMVFEEGTLTITSKGNNSFDYTFTANEKYADLQFKKDITLTATDKDGDTATTTITVGQEKDPDIITEKPGEPGVKGTEVIVDEATRPTGSGTADADGTVHNYKGSNAFSVNLHGEEGSIVIKAGLEEVTFNIGATTKASGVPDATPSGNTVLHVNGVTITFTEAKLVNGQWQVNYKYELDGNITHDQENVTGAADAKVDKSITITVTAKDGEPATANMTVEVHDDGPVLTAVNVIGATKANDDQSLLIDDSAETISVKLEGMKFGADMEGKDSEGNPVVAKVVLSVSYDGETKTATFTMQNGVLTRTSGDSELNYNADNGTFTFTRPENHYKDGNDHNDEYTFTATVTDSDGDHVEESVTVSTNQTPEIDLKGIEVHESKLQANAQTGQEAGSGHGGEDATTEVPGSFRVDTHGEGGTLVLAWGNTTTTITLDENDNWTPGQGEVVTLNNGYATLTLGGVVNGQVSYTYTLNKALSKQDTSANLWNKVQADPVKVTLTDGHHNDVATDDLTVTVVDDAPVVEVTMDEEPVQSLNPLFSLNFTEKNFSSKYDAGGALGYKKYDSDHWTATGGGAKKAGYDNWVTMNSGAAKGVELTASFVHYQYSLDSDGHLVATNVVDLNNGIYNSAKALNFSTTNGLSVGGANSDHSDAWNGTTAGEIHIGDGTLYMSQGPTEKNYPDKRGLLLGQYGGKDESAYNEICGTNVSEAVIMDLGKVAYGININLGSLDSSDRVLLTFLMTPKNSDDNVIVKTVVVTTKNNGQDIFVPEGFSKVFVSALPQDTYSKDELSADGLWVNSNRTHDEGDSGFTIKGVTFFQPKYTATGTVAAISADGISRYEWDTTVFDGNGSNAADVRIRGLQSGDYKVEMTKTGSGEWTATLRQAAGGPTQLAGQTLFTAKLWRAEDGSWHWQVEQSLEFVVLNNNVDPFQIVATDGDDDKVAQSVPVDIRFNRFHESLNGKVNASSTDTDEWDDILIGSGDSNTLMYGKGGDDVLIADGLKKDSLEGLDAGVQRIVNKLQNLKHTVGGSEDRNNVLINDFKELNETQRDKLGEALEKLENQDPGHFGNDALYGGMGNDFLIAGAGDDIIDGSGIRIGEADGDIVYAGSGNDIIFYKSTAEYIHGGTGTDILIGAKVKPADIANAKKVSNVEVLLSTDQASTKPLQITGHESLLLYGIVLGENSVRLDAEMWEKNEDGSWSGVASETKGLTLYDVSGDGAPFEGIISVPKAELQAEPQSEAAAAMSLDEYALDDVSEPLFGGHETQGGTGDAAAAEDAPRLFAAAPSAGEAPLDGRNVIEGDEDEPNMLFGTDGDDVIIGGSAGDFIDGGAGSDTIYAGGGDDLIVYDPTDYLIDGGTGIDFLLAGSGEQSHTLADMLKNWEKQGEHDEKMPMVHDVEVMIKGVDTMGLQNMEALAAKFGFSMDKDANGRDVLILGDQWKEVEGSANGITTTYTNGAGVTLETTLQASGETDQGEQAAQAIVLTSNG